MKSEYLLSDICRIIPFVAADALVKDKDDRQPSVTNYPAGDSPTESVFTDSASQVNRFSPPVETEGTILFNSKYLQDN